MNPREQKTEPLPDDSKIEQMAMSMSGCKKDNHYHDCPCSAYEDGAQTVRKIAKNLIDKKDEIFRSFISTHQLTSKWEEFIITNPLPEQPTEKADFS